MWGADSVATTLSTNPEESSVSRRPGRPAICTALCVAALANALIPLVLFPVTGLFGQTAPGYRAALAFVVLLEYLIAFLLILFHANVGLASGYSVATSAVLTIGSAGLTYITLAPAGWGWSAVSAELFVVCWLAFAILSNAVFFLASVRYARAIHPRMHLGGFSLGVAACLALFLLYTRILH
jgi:hypothetical protein